MPPPFMVRIFGVERKEAEQLGLRAARSKRNPDAARRLDNEARDFQKMQADLVSSVFRKACQEGMQSRTSSSSQ